LFDEYPTLSLVLFRQVEIQPFNFSANIGMEKVQQLASIEDGSMDMLVSLLKGE